MSTEKYGYGNKANEITEEMLSKFVVDCDEGRIYRKTKKGLSEVKGRRNQHGYKQFMHKSKLYLFHRVIYQAAYGDLTHEWFVDHINRVRDDNRACNLRKVTWSQNMSNKKFFQTKSVYPPYVRSTIREYETHKMKYYYVQVRHKGKIIKTKSFNKDLQGAILYARETSLKLHGEESPYLMEEFSLDKLIKFKDPEPTEGFRNFQIPVGAGRPRKYQKLPPYVGYAFGRNTKGECKYWYYQVTYRFESGGQHIIRCAQDIKRAYESAKKFSILEDPENSPYTKEPWKSMDMDTYKDPYIDKIKEERGLD